MKVWIEADNQSICNASARALVQLIDDTLQVSEKFTIALAGGTTPKVLYQLLATEELSQQIPWQQIHVYFGDERSVGPEHEDSNYRMACEALLNHVAIPSENIHRIQGEANNIKSAAASYAQELDQGLSKNEDNYPQFDLVLLGLGPDGHVASLFPDTDILKQKDAWADAVWVEKLSTWRVSITYPLINHAKHVWLFVAGETKANIIEQVLGDKAEEFSYPVQGIEAQGQLLWFLDEAAASKLDKD